MLRKIDTTPRFERRLVSFVKAHQDLRSKTSSLIERLSKDPFDSKNKTHTLSGNLKGMYAASINHTYRIVFVMGDEAITLINIGSHDEVY